MTNPANEEVQAAMERITKECSRHGYAFVAFAVRLPHDGSAPVFAYNVSGGPRAVADVLREAADLLEGRSEAGAATYLNAESVN